MGVVVRRYIDILIIIITFLYSTCSYYVAFFWQQHPYFFVHLKKFNMEMRYGKVKRVMQILWDL